MKWYLKCLRHYADFKGRARRKEYWMFTLFNLIFAIFFLVIDCLLGWWDETMGVGVLEMIYSCAVAVPGIALTVRRLHDIGRSGWSYFMGLIPLVGPILVLIWACTEGDYGDNYWGPDPKLCENSMSAKPESLSKTKLFGGYAFKLYSLEGFGFDEAIEIDGLSDSDNVLYCFTKRVYDGDKYTHEYLYLGKADREKLAALKNDGCNCLGVYKCKEGEDPNMIESSILANMKFKENIM